MKRIAFFIPFMGCRRRCVYCNQSAITGASAPSPEDVAARLSRETDPIELAYFGGSFARIGIETMTAYLRAIEAAPNGSIVRFSTHPTDLLDKDHMKVISHYPVKTIELGTPSLDPDVLAKCAREESGKETLSVLKMLQSAGYRIGVQMMIGLPGQSAASVESDLRAFAQIKNDAVWDMRIYPCLVLRGTLLEAMMSAGSYTPMSLDAAIRATGALLKLARDLGFNPIRVGLQESATLSEDVVAGPYHPAFGELAMGEEMAVRLAEKPETEWSVSQCEISKLFGHDKHGLLRLAELTNNPLGKVQCVILRQIKRRVIV